MTGEDIFGLIIMLVCSGGCGLLFLGIGIWAQKSENPVHFWSGVPVDPKSVKDVSAYNMACARMWKMYAVPYLISCVLAVAKIWIQILIWPMVFCLVTAGTFGIGWLIRTYHKIERTYIEKLVYRKYP